MAPPLVRFDPLDRSAAALENETILDVARRAGAPIANACGGVGVCNRCNVRPIEHEENIGPPTSIELRLRSECRLGPSERLACQSTVHGKCTVTTGYWGGR